MSIAVPILDALALVAFGAALWTVLTIPVTPEGTVNAAGKACFALAMAVYVFAMFSNVLEHAEISAALDPAEDYLEVLFPALVLYAVYATNVRRRERELLSSQRAALRSQEMLLGIMDSAPAGILVVDSAGRVTFANDTAKAVLDLNESESGTFTDPGWTVRLGDGQGSRTFDALLREDGSHGAVPVAVEWPNGWRIELDVRTERLADSAGRVGGLVASFLPPAGVNPQ